MGPEVKNKQQELLDSMNLRVSTTTTKSEWFCQKKKIKEANIYDRFYDGDTEPKVAAGVAIIVGG